MHEVAFRFYETLTRSQFMPAEAMLRHQRSLLEPLLRHAKAHVPYYRDGGHLDPIFKADGAIDWSYWPRLPIFSRTEAAANPEAFTAEKNPPYIGDITPGSTSGSTGQPFRHLRSQIQVAADCALTERLFTWFDFDRSASYAKIKDSHVSALGGAEGTTSSGWNLFNQKAPLHHFHLRHTTDEQAGWLLHTGARYLETYPNCAALVFDQLENKAADLGLRAIVTTGEILREHVLDR
jgi:phenylacetate-coenzyme A ligase PaaK-like adenylate-forming protein